MSVFTQGLSAADTAQCRKLAGKKVVLDLASSDAPSWVGEWQRRAGDLTITTDHEDKLIVSGDAPGAVASLTFALFRKQIPVLLLGENHTGITSELLTEATGDAKTAIATFLTPPKTMGRIFTIEGADGAGKQTQTEMLVARLEAEGYPVKTIDFPHDSAAYGKQIREILTGKHGSIGEVSPLLFATVYSMNRDDVKPRIQHWLSQGYNVVLDRYMESSFGHQAAKLETEEEKQQMIRRLTAYEVNWLGIPPSHRVLYLDLDPAVAFTALQKDTARTGLDIHETAKSDYKNSVRTCFRWCCSSFPHWSEIPQQDAKMTRKSRDEVHENIWDSWKGEFVNRA